MGTPSRLLRLTFHGQKHAKMFGIDGFGEMFIEAGFDRAAFVLGPTPVHGTRCIQFPA